VEGNRAVLIGLVAGVFQVQLEREWLADRGQSAFVMPADVRGTTWQRVLVGRYPTRAEAEASLARLRDLDAAGAP